jgi:hypothetical protein
MGTSRAMAKYVIYCLNERGGFSRSEWIDADNDADALIQARKLSLEQDCEVWLRDRMVGRVPAARPQL